MTARIVALPWVRKEDYEDVRRLMEDGASWPASYEGWLEHAEAEERNVLIGMRVMRVMIEPYEFEVWCAANDMQKDGTSRDAFAAENAGIR